MSFFLKSRRLFLDRSGSAVCVVLGCVFPVLMTLGASTVEAAGEDSKVPLTLWDIQSTHSSYGELRESGRGIGAQAISTQQLSYLKRISLSEGPWYLGVGVQGESFSFFGNNKAAVRQLRDVAGQLSLEYFVGGTQAAALSVKPGFYFENHVRAGSFDAPVQLVSGIPITPTLNGVIGVAAARFYHHSIPIVGLSWTIQPDLRLDAVFPEPALTYTPNKSLEWKLGGELQSGGFRTDSGTPVEYYSYQIKNRVIYSVTKSLKVSGALGYEVERSFDYFHRGQRQKGQGAFLFQVGAGLVF